MGNEFSLHFKHKWTTNDLLLSLSYFTNIAFFLCLSEESAALSLDETSALRTFNIDQLFEAEESAQKTLVSLEQQQNQLEYSEADDSSQSSTAETKQQVLQREKNQHDPKSFSGRILEKLTEHSTLQVAREKEEKREMERKRLQRRRSDLVELGIVSESQAESLINDADGPLPNTEIQEKFDNAMKERREKEEAQRKKGEREKAKRAFKDDWLLNKERQMVQLSDELLQETMPNDRRPVITSLLEITIHKVKSFHEKLGTISLSCAVEERKKKCVELNLVEPCDAHLVTDLFSPLPTTKHPQVVIYLSIYLFTCCSLLRQQIKSYYCIVCI